MGSIQSTANQPTSALSWLIMMMLSLLLIFTSLNGLLSDVVIDLSKARLDEESGNYCVVQKVCVTNPPDELTNSGCPVYPPGCDCDEQDPESVCPNDYRCIMCKCLPAKCDCNPLADDPNSF